MSTEWSATAKTEWTATVKTEFESHTPESHTPESQATTEASSLTDILDSPLPLVLPYEHLQELLPLCETWYEMPSATVMSVPATTGTVAKKKKNSRKDYREMRLRNNIAVARCRRHKAEEFARLTVENEALREKVAMMRARACDLLDLAHKYRCMLKHMAPELQLADVPRLSFTPPRAPTPPPPPELRRSTRLAARETAAMAEPEEAEVDVEEEGAEAEEEEPGEPYEPDEEEEEKDEEDGNWNRYAE